MNVLTNKKREIINKKKRNKQRREIETKLRIWSETHLVRILLHERLEGEREMKMSSNSSNKIVIIDKITFIVITTIITTIVIVFIVIIIIIIIIIINIIIIISERF